MGFLRMAFPSVLINPVGNIKLPFGFKITRQNFRCRLMQLFWLFWNWRGHLHLMNTLGEPCFEPVKPYHRQAQYKYLGEYLLSGMSVSDKLQALNCHYDFLLSLVKAGRLGGKLEEKQVVWQKQKNDALFEILIGMPDISFREGDLMLFFAVNGKTIFIMTFTIIPASLIQPGMNGVAILAGGLQGMSGCHEWLRLAAKANGDIFPSVLLFTALQALSVYWGIPRIYGVSAIRQASPSVYNNPERYTAVYDDFWEAQGGLHEGDFYHFHPLPAEKSLESLSGKHLARSRRKRALRKQLLDEMSVSLDQLFSK